MIKTSAVVTFVLGSAALAAQQRDVPLANWTIPPYTQNAGEITTMTDATPPRAFVGVQPCRVADTRGNGAPIQGGIFADGELRTWDLTGICGLPAGVDAISTNFTVTGSPAAPPGAFLLAWPTGGPTPPVSILNYQAGQTLANAAIVPLAAGEQLNVNVSHSTHVIMDVNGYFSETLGNPNNFLQLINNSAFFTYFGWNQSTNCPGACGIYMQTDSTAANVSILGAAVGATGRNFGVEGSTLSTTAGSAGVHGISAAAAGRRYGVIGDVDLSMSADQDSAGVLGRDRLTPILKNYQIHPAGVRGESTFQWGVVGISNGGVGVDGIVNDLLGNFHREGRLGVGDYGVYAFGDVGATGTKFFVEPHPTDPSKIIRYVALEGNEPGTYFRGRGRFRNGLATIDVPEDFRMMTDEEGLTVQVTPIGGMASVGVLRIGLDGIVVQSSRDLDFSYTVNGIRRSHKDGMNPIAQNTFEYVPRSAEEKIPAYLTERQKEMLVRNGTYNADGTVNMETARRLGWDRVWADRAGRPTPEPTPQ